MINKQHDVGVISVRAVKELLKRSQITGQALVFEGVASGHLAVNRKGASQKRGEDYVIDLP